MKNENTNGKWNIKGKKKENAYFTRNAYKVS
jgi:hypothetical protein